MYSKEGEERIFIFLPTSLLCLSFSSICIPVNLGVGISDLRQQQDYIFPEAKPIRCWRFSYTSLVALNIIKLLK